MSKLNNTSYDSVRTISNTHVMRCDNDILPEGILKKEREGERVSRR